jgi:hypothetical protein
MSETTPTPSTDRPVNDPSISNTDIVLVVLDDLGGADRPIHIEEVAETAWQQVPARFSWPKLQKYPDLDAVDVTLRAAKKNEGLVSGSKREGWMLTPAGIARVRDREAPVRAFVERLGRAGRTENRRERGGFDSTAMRRLAQLRDSAAVRKYRDGQVDDISVYDFMAFFNINQYMPSHKYKTNRQAVENLARDDDELLAVVSYLHSRFGDTYKADLQKGSTDGTA